MGTAQHPLELHLPDEGLRMRSCLDRFSESARVLFCELNHELDCVEELLKLTELIEPCLEDISFLEELLRAFLVIPEARRRAQMVKLTDTFSTMYLVKDTSRAPDGALRAPRVDDSSLGG